MSLSCSFCKCLRKSFWLQSHSSVTLHPIRSQHTGSVFLCIFSEKIFLVTISQTEKPHDIGKRLCSAVFSCCSSNFHGFREAQKHPRFARSCNTKCNTGLFQKNFLFCLPLKGSKNFGTIGSRRVPAFKSPPCPVGKSKAYQNF